MSCWSCPSCLLVVVSALIADGPPTSLVIYLNIHNSAVKPLDVNIWHTGMTGQSSCELKRDSKTWLSLSVGAGDNDNDNDVGQQR